MFAWSAMDIIPPARPGNDSGSGIADDDPAMPGICCAGSDIADDDPARPGNCSGSGSDIADDDPAKPSNCSGSSGVDDDGPVMSGNCSGSSGVADDGPAMSGNGRGGVGGDSADDVEGSSVLDAAAAAFTGSSSSFLLILYKRYTARSSSLAKSTEIDPPKLAQIASKIQIQTTKIDQST
ncbi:Os01g0339550 [Oryza sativa Japonica Group]|uniref:Os01g0339550 protein n=1 Tax=Oryza sativa subsp. japonica TaxID=39947 RepID=A0A0P0V252_ORYSJ|nr:Os01g0339550 [Oryza sativa Japonica Group]